MSLVELNCNQSIDRRNYSFFLFRSIIADIFTCWWDIHTRKKAEKNKPQTLSHIYALFNSNQYMVVHHIGSFTFAWQSLLSVSAYARDMNINAYIITILMIHKERVRRDALFVYIMGYANSVKDNGNIDNSDQVNRKKQISDWWRY